MLLICPVLRLLWRLRLLALLHHVSYRHTAAGISLSCWLLLLLLYSL
jgi:hypothetical protein